LPSAPAADTAGEAEIARLRGELAKQLERAQAAEDRISTLEADVLAAARGVSALPVEPAHGAHERVEPQREPVPPAPAGVDRYDDMWSTPYTPPERTTPAHAEPKLVEGGSVPAADHDPQPSERDEPRPSMEGEPAASADQAAASGDQAAASSEPQETQGEVSAEDMWSLRARLADAAARKKHHLDVE
jgi:hypothetical protein